MKVVQIAFGAVMVALGLVMLFIAFRDGGHDGGAGQAMMAPLGLIGAGAVAISVARRPRKKW